MSKATSSKKERQSVPVIAVIATCGKDRVDFLLERALPSVKRQIHLLDLVVVVSDNDKKDDPITREDICSCFDPVDHDKLALLQNSRTRNMSGTGAWNTGIVEAFKRYGEECWVAILDDDDEWKDNHIQACLDAAADSEDCCKWVASGIVRKRSNGKNHYEPIPQTMPTAKDFFTTNPGIQGSNLFVKCGALVQAGMFDERLPSTTDRDLCIRLRDILQGKVHAFASTKDLYTVVHHAGTHERVSTRGSPSKIEGLKIFYYKHGPRMNADQRAAFKLRAKERFGCDETEFVARERQVHANAQEHPIEENEILRSWSGDELKLNRRTKPLLPPLDMNLTSEVLDKKEVIVGIISGDMHRLEPLLRDLACASESPHSDFRAFVVVFANHTDPAFAREVRDVLKKYKLRGHVIETSSNIAQQILHHCRSSSQSKENLPVPLPICLSRTVLQVFIYYMTRQLDGVQAVVILDDDKRLPMGWSPFRQDNGHRPADIQIGRDLRTPPNPSLLSLRTNLLDILYAFDLEHLKSEQQNDEVGAFLQFCNSIDILEEKFDWYYDKSSSRTNHLEAPVLSHGFSSTDEEIFSSVEMYRTLLSSLLVGTPFARDVIPCESGPTGQRGGCLVVTNKDDSSFDVLAVEQDAPLISFGEKTIHSRRSDSFWCRQVEERMNKSIIEVNQSLYVYHDNSFDRVPAGPVMRRTMVQEVLGAVLCRSREDQSLFKEKAMLDLKMWLSRVNGLLLTLKSRPYFNSEMEEELISPLVAIVDEERWQQEVFDVMEKELDRLQDFKLCPTDFASHAPNYDVRGNFPEIMRQWKVPKRIRSVTDGLGGTRLIGTCDECCAIDCACAHTSSRAYDENEANPPSSQSKHVFRWPINSTSMPIEAIKDNTPHFFSSKKMPEGGLEIEIVALVNGDKISEADVVHVRIHSECLTGDIFYSKRCDCGQQKLRFLDIMNEKSHSVLLYIKGHEGRGAGLHNKTGAYSTLESDDEGQITHIEALKQQGCEVDARRCDAAVKFLRDHLKIKFKSIVLHTNNSKKRLAVEEHYGEAPVKFVNMSTVTTKHNRQYLKEKEELLDHKGLIKPEGKSLLNSLSLLAFVSIVGVVLAVSKGNK